MAYSIHISEGAVEDLDAALDWYVAKKHSLAERFYEEYFKVEDRIYDNPLQFPIIEENIRRARFAKTFPYSIYFVIEQKSAIIIAIFHNSRNPNIWKGRTE